ncbi:MAG: HAD family hydrolase, partial [Anaerolineae bacterium]|nr:HAD family hydrolase [Anaerolineae bacterium]
MFDIIVFDADDTLWHNETLFHEMERRFAHLIAPYIVENGGQSPTPEWIAQRLYQNESANIRFFGYGIKSFALSMVQAAVEITDGTIPSRALVELVEIAKEMIAAPMHLLPHVAEVIPQLAADHRLMIITKGDLIDQHGKVARSGLAEHFDIAEVVSEKDPATYRDVFARYTLDPRRVVMVGNSLKSDVLPVIALGGRGVHIPGP